MYLLAFLYYLIHLVYSFHFSSFIFLSVCGSEKLQANDLFIYDCLEIGLSITVMEIAWIEPQVVPLKWSEVAQSSLTLCDPMDCSIQGSSIHGIFQARVLEQVAISFSRGSSQPRDRTQVSHIAGRCCTVWATREA